MSCIENVKDKVEEILSLPVWIKIWGINIKRKEWSRHTSLASDTHGLTFANQRRLEIIQTEFS